MNDSSHFPSLQMGRSSQNHSQAETQVVPKNYEWAKKGIAIFNWV